jgi:membrane fusion protein, multidrug efflux system
MTDSVTGPEAPTAPTPAAAPAPATRAAEAPAARPVNAARRHGFTILAVVVGLSAIAYGSYWFLYARYFESTDDTYVDGDVVQITSEVPGTVIGLHADDTQFVSRDQLLLELDPADAEVAVRVAEANLGRAVRAVRALFDQGGQLRDDIVYREIALRRAEHDYERRTGLLRDGAVSTEELQHTRDDMTEVRASLAATREQLGETEARIDGTTIATNPEVLAAAAKVRDAWLQLRRTRITSPVSGVVARRTVQVGQRVAAGTPLMGVVPLDALWVNANFKEVQLRDMRVGQPVKLRVDVYGGSVVYHGKVVGLAAGTGSAFALLPAENASGNWIKIVQRLPVRVQLDPGELREHPLRIGESVTATVDIRDTSGPLVARQVRRVPIPSQPSLANDPAVEARIARIIRDNLGEPKGQERLSANWVYGGR